MDQRATMTRQTARPEATSCASRPGNARLANVRASLNAAIPVQRLRRAATALSPSGREAPIQRRLVAPAVTGGAALAGPVDAPNTDSVAPGTRTLASYTATIQAAAASRAAAMAAARAEYRSIGRSLAGGRFLCDATVRSQILNNRAFAGQVFDILEAHDLVWAPPMAALTDQAKQADVLQVAPGGSMNPAQMDLLRNQPGIDLKDPLRVTIAAPYPGDSSHRLSVTAEFTEGQKGYISAVRDTGSNIDAKLMDRPNYAGEFPPNVVAPNPKSEGERQVKKQFIIDQGTKQGAISTFSNVHHTDTNEDVATQIGRLGTATTRVNLEGGVDAVTKVVAEGGRFDCVAALGTAIRNDSIFYASHDGGFRTITFRELWKLWTRHFNGVYGVADASVTTFLRKPALPGGVVQSDAEPAATGYNYDVANSTVR